MINANQWFNFKTEPVLRTLKILAYFLLQTESLRWSLFWKRSGRPSLFVVIIYPPFEKVRSTDSV